jgi:hypothetical protein
MSKQDPDHPILPRANAWGIVGLNVQMEPSHGSEPFLDLTLRRHSEERRLRFWSPQDLEIEKGGPRHARGFCNLDVRARQLDGLAVRVDDYEGSHGVVRFWARDVEELP